MAGNLGFRFRMEGEAIASLKRLAGFNPRSYLHRIAKSDIETHSYLTKETTTLQDSLLTEARLSYAKAFRGEGLRLKDGVLNNVYRAVKEAFFGHRRMGELTGSTYHHALKVIVYEKSAVAVAEMRGSWPRSEEYTGEQSLPFNMVAKPLLEALQYKVAGYAGSKDKLETILKESIMMSVPLMRRETAYSAFMYKKQKGRVSEMRKGGITGPVIMDIGSAGVSIIWPESAKKRLGFHDLHMKSEPYASKRFKRNINLSMRQNFVENFAMGELDAYIDELWGFKKIAVPLKPSEVSVSERELEVPIPTTAEGVGEIAVKEREDYTTATMAPEQDYSSKLQWEMEKNIQIEKKAKEALGIMDEEIIELPQKSIIPTMNELIARQVDEVTDEVESAMERSRRTTKGTRRRK